MLFGLAGFAALITVAKYIDNRVVRKLDQDIRMSGAGIEERIAELDLDQLKNVPSIHHCKRIRVNFFYQYQTCFSGYYIQADTPQPQRINYRYTPPRPFLSFLKLVFSNESYFHRGNALRNAETLGGIYKDGTWQVTIRSSILESYSGVDINDYPISYRGQNFTVRIVRKGIWK